MNKRSTVAPTYPVGIFQTISEPMDLRTIKRQVLQGEYSMPEDIRRDVYLMCNNAIKFNGKVRKDLCLLLLLFVTRHQA